MSHSQADPPGSPRSCSWPRPHAAWPVTTWGRWSARSGWSRGSGPPSAVAPENDQKSRGRSPRPWARRASSPQREYKDSWNPRRSTSWPGPTGSSTPPRCEKALDADVPESRRRLNPEGRRPRRPADDLVRHDRRAPPGRRARRSRTGSPRTTSRASRSTSRSSARATAAGASSGRRWATSPPPTTGCPRSASTAAAPPRPPSTPAPSPALKEIGVEVEPTGTEAPRGEPKTANPIYTVRWGDREPPGGDRVLEDLLRRRATPSRASPP